MKKCRICHNPINAFMSFGKMPIANGFLSPQDFDSEYFFELAPAFCSNCQMFQLVEQPAPTSMFHENYAFFSQSSKAMINHFAKMAKDMQDYYLQDHDPFVVELGSNDGILLQHFAEANIRHLGVEPSSNVAKVARNNGVNTLCAFFCPETAANIVSKHGQADIVTASNVMCHIPDLPGIAEGIAALLKSTGYLIFEDPYLGDVIQKTSYDQIYDEHVFLFSVNSIKNAFDKVGLEVIDVIPQTTHGGSMRYILAKKGQYKITPRVNEQLLFEESLKLHDPNTYLQFKYNCEQSKTKLFHMLDELSEHGNTIVGYAATSKSTTVINYCNITSKHLQYICDTTPIKQNKFSPGAHIPIKSHDEFVKRYPNYAILFAWNHAKEIFAKEGSFITLGGRWIMFVPEVKILYESHR